MKTFVMNKSLFQCQTKFLKKKTFFFILHDVKNKQLKEENEKLRKENQNENENEKLRKEENEKLRQNNIVKDAEIKESIEKSKEIKSPEEYKIPQILILIGLTKISLKKFQLSLTAANFIKRIKQVNSTILILKTWLILEIIQLVKYLLKKI